MNMYYHVFNVGFNIWMLYIPFTLILAVIIGLSRYKYVLVGEVKAVIRRRIPGKMVNKFTILLSMILFILLCAESYFGMVQYFDNIAPRDQSGIYSLVLAPIAFVLIAFLYRCILNIVVNITSSKRLAYMREYKAEQEVEMCADMMKRQLGIKIGWKRKINTHLKRCVKWTRKR